MQTIVAQQDYRPLEAVADLIDLVVEIVPRNPIAHAANTSAASKITELVRQEIRNKISEVTRQLRELTMKIDNNGTSGRQGRKFSNRRRTCSTSQSRSRNRPFRTIGNQRLCWYHFNYQDKASKCVKACDLRSENVKSSRQGRRLTALVFPAVFSLRIYSPRKYF